MVSIPDGAEGLELYFLQITGIVQSVQQRAEWSGFDSQEGRGFYVLQDIQKSSGIHPASYHIRGGEAAVA
jgi:hypothetical protein